MLIFYSSHLYNIDKIISILKFSDFCPLHTPLPKSCRIPRQAIWDRLLLQAQQKITHIRAEQGTAINLTKW